MNGDLSWKFCSLYECWPSLKFSSRSVHNFSQEVDYKIWLFDALAGVCAHHIFFKILSIVHFMNDNLSWKFHQDLFINKKVWCIDRGMRSSYLSQNLINCSMHECWPILKISSRSVHDFLSYVANKQADSWRGYALIISFSNPNQLFLVWMLTYS